MGSVSVCVFLCVVAKRSSAGSSHILGNQNVGMKSVDKKVRHDHRLAHIKK